MRDSDTYLAILDEGRADGEVRGVRQTVLRIGRKRFGEPEGDLIANLQAIADLPDFKGKALMAPLSWQELFFTLASASDAIRIRIWRSWTKGATLD